LKNSEVGLKAFKIAALIVLVSALCVFLGYQTATRTMDGSGLFYTCQDVGCLVVASYITGPLYSFGYFLVIGSIYLCWRRFVRWIQ
jgi:hypothetical protein